jgi:DNA-binding MarR family transcriptional regulator
MAEDWADDRDAVLADGWLLLMRVGADALREPGAPSAVQLALLNLLADGGAVALMDAARRLGVSGATATRAAESAHRRGWIRKTRDPHDRRIVWLTLTEAGDAVRRDFRGRVAGRLQAMAGAVAEEAWAGFWATLRGLVGR